ncbi:MAG: PKD domain-containing protein, partial [Bacteroidales bacterium]|nr:PKD domain-containing protein [Bacteroidales bacterium]
MTLTVTNSEGCTIASPGGECVWFPNSRVFDPGQCKDSPVHFTDLSHFRKRFNSWQWNFGDPGSGIFNTSSDQNPTHSYAATGNYTVTLITLTLNGCSDTISYPVTIKPCLLPTLASRAPARIILHSSPCVHGDPPIASWYWSLGMAAIPYSRPAMYTYALPGPIPLRFTVTDTAGYVRTSAATRSPMFPCPREL